MRHIGGEARSGDELRAVQDRQRRWIRLCLKSKRELVRTYVSKMKAAKVTPDAGELPHLPQTWTNGEIADAIMAIEDQYNV